MSETEMVELSNKAVRGFINKKFSTFFSEDDIQDIVQDTLLSMWERRDTYDPERGTKFAWAWMIAKSKVLDAAASKARRNGHFTHFKDGELPIDCTPYMVSAEIRILMSTITKASTNICAISETVIGSMAVRKPRKTLR